MEIRKVDLTLIEGIFITKVRKTEDMEIHKKLNQTCQKRRKEETGDWIYRE